MTEIELEHLSHSNSLADDRLVLLALVTSPKLYPAIRERACETLQGDREPAPVDLATSLGLRDGATYSDLARKLLDQEGSKP